MREGPPRQPHVVEHRGPLALAQHARKAGVAPRRKADRVGALSPVALNVDQGRPARQRGAR
eukprot:6205112-Alexandrium_andersonii.AAC.1